PCSDVASLSLPDGHVEIYAHASNGALWRIWESGGKYAATNSQRVRQPGTVGLSAVSFAGAVQLFTAASGQIQQISGSGATWSPTLTNLGAPSGVKVSAPLASLDQHAASLELFALGSDGAVWRRVYAGGWSTWASLGR